MSPARGSADNREKSRWRRGSPGNRRSRERPKVPLSSAASDRGPVGPPRHPLRADTSALSALLTSKRPAAHNSAERHARIPKSGPSEPARLIAIPAGGRWPTAIDGEEGGGTRGSAEFGRAGSALPRLH